MSNPVLPAAGTAVATETVGGNDFQKIKLFDPTPGSEQPVGTEANPMQTCDMRGEGLLRRILQMLLAPLGYDKSLQRSRVTAAVENLPTLANVTTVGTVTTVTNQTNIGGFNADAQVRAMINAAWNLNVRARIT